VNSQNIFFFIDNTTRNEINHTFMHVNLKPTHKFSKAITLFDTQ